MSAVMEEDIKLWTARAEAALVLEIIQGNAPSLVEALGENLRLSTAVRQCDQIITGRPS